MKNALLAALAAVLPVIHAEAQTRYNSQPGGKSSVKVTGASTLHEWSMEGHVIGGFIELPAGVTPDAAGVKDGKLPATVKANILVNTIHSKAEHLPDVMDNLMLDHMKAKDNPRIFYTVSTLQVTNSAAGKPLGIAATGDLAIAGVTNKVTFPVSIEQVDPTHLKVTGQSKFKMTDFKVDPPAPTILGLGTLKCADDVTIDLEWYLQKR